ncbi:protein phosphatase [Streptomyces sp. NPDC002602]|uniref:protein-tyrosine phosphatase family protein n=1 Tax=Streptomyces sp. NPDC002602 TaxID=3364654 RepID=UPI00368CF53F
MKTRQKDRDVPEPDEPWSEIRPGLWMGGHFWTDSAGEVRPAVAGDEFDLVISLFTRAGHGPHLAVQHLITELPDGPLTTDQIHSVQELARTTTRALRAGRTVLVRCHSGHNRSGLVIAQSLIELGHDPHTAISLIRRRRSPRALNNETFVQYLSTGLHVAYLLSGLDTSD